MPVKLNSASGGSMTLQSGGASDLTLTFPTTNGTANYALTTNGSGTMSWAQISLTAAVTGTLPVANGGTGITALGTGIATFLGTPSSANLASAITDETGSGLLVFGTSPTLTTPLATGLKETKTAPAISAGTLTLDCSAGNVFAVSLNANITTLTFSNVPTTGNAYGMTLSFTADGTARTITWGSAVKWPGGTAPTLTSTLNKVDTFVLTTWDGGTTWYAFTGGQNA